MAKHTRREVERFRECRRCGSQNTKEVVSSDPDTCYSFMYYGWCFDCLEIYEYNIRVDEVWDRKGRI